mmetsp:Transcript_1619/g.5218  ORF Transcript_1619/g.5218 Transcript_1619/m.5218 type:complete len:434 (-) Transcript_1619:220-1521(-)
MSTGTLGGTLLCAGIIAPLAATGVTVLMSSMRRCGATVAVRSYGDVVRVAFGARLANAVDALIVVYSFGTCIGYLILLADVATPFVMLGIGPGHDEMGVWRVVLSCVALVCFVLCTLRSLSALKNAAVLGILATVFIVLMLAQQAVIAPCHLGDCADQMGRQGWCTPEQAEKTPATCNGELGVSLWPQGTSQLLGSLPLYAFALQCHIQGAIVFTELPPRLRHDSATRMIAFSATALMILLDMSVGLAGFLRFGAQTQGNVLKNFGATDILANGARVCLGFSALCSFPAQHFPARLALYGFYARARGKTSAEPTMTFIGAEALTWVAIVSVFAQLVGSALAPVFQLVGAVCGSSVIFTLPGAIWLKLGPRDSAARPLVGGLLMAGGLFILATGTTVTLQQILAKKPAVEDVLAVGGLTAGGDGDYSALFLSLL